jgi:hypothetical protein
MSAITSWKQALFSRLRGTATIFLSRLSGQQNVELYPESSDKFFATVVAAQLSFVTDAQGRATELVLHPGGI